MKIRCYASDAHRSFQGGFTRGQSRVNKPASHSSRTTTEEEMCEEEKGEL